MPSPVRIGPVRVNVIGYQSVRRDGLAHDVEAGNLRSTISSRRVAETPFGDVKDSGYGREGGTEGFPATRLPETSRTG
jgi:acyl-CoA reductase-like NAD-dependent aldehyde dehydrogenase